MALSDHRVFATAAARLARAIQEWPQICGRNCRGLVEAKSNDYRRQRTKINPSAETERLRRFSEWLEVKFKLPISSNWAEILQFVTADDAQALSRFFELYREWRRAGCPEVYHQPPEA